MNSVFEIIVHDLRMRGWSRIEAEGEALERIERMRAASAGRNPEGEDPAEGLRAEHEHAVAVEDGQTPKGSRP